MAVTTEKTYRKRGALIAGAGAAGVVAGTAAVYVSGLSDSNVSLSAADCADALQAAKRAGPFARGEVAAFRVATAPDSLDDLGFVGPDGKPTDIAAFAGKTLLV